MKIIDRYIRRALLSGVFITMALLLPLIGFLLLADELDNVGVGKYSLGDVFLVIGFSLPRYAHQIFPIGGLIGSLLGLGGLANHGELNAMRAVGISLHRIILSVLKAGLIVALCSLFINEIIVPISEDKASDLRANLLSEHSAIKTLYGFWARDGNTFVNIREIMPEGRLRNLYIYKFDNTRHLISSTHAVSATYNNQTKAWELATINTSYISDDGVTIEQKSTMLWPSLIDPGMLSLLVINPQILPIWVLYRYMRFMQANGLNITTYQAMFWSKLANPLVTMVMIALAVPLLFGNLRRVGTGQRIFVGVLLGIAFYILDTIASRLAITMELNPIIAAFAPSFLCLIGTFWIMRRT